MKTILLLLLTLYRKIFSPFMENIFGKACRFNPTCSQYAYEALEHYGVIKGSVLSIKRVARCHPFSKPGFDPLVR